KCLDVENASTSDGANVQQLACSGSANQRWFLNARPTVVNLLSAYSSHCAEVAGSSMADQASIQQSTCSQSASQGWSLGPSTTVGGVTYYNLVPGLSAKCMEVGGGSLNNGAKIQQLTCAAPAADKQLWSLTEDSGGFVKIVNKRSNKCLEI